MLVNRDENDPPTQSQKLIHRLAANATRLSLIASARDIVDAMLLGSRREVVDTLLAFHAGGVRLTDVPRAGGQVQGVGGDEVLALGRDPFRALAGRHVHDVHGVDLLEAAAAGFAEEEVDDDGAEEVAGREDVAVAVVDCACDEGGEEGDEEVLRALLVVVFTCISRRCELVLTQIQLEAVARPIAWARYRVG